MTRRLALASLACFVACPQARARQTKPARGTASFYGWHEHGKLMANGHRFHALGATAAHRTLPLGSVVIVTNLQNGKHVRVTITDRGPYVGHRLIDLSLGAARVLGIERQGLAPVMVEPISP
jgi:rare lipoprotein A